MIKAEELRIGNYVKSARTGEIIPVDWIAIKCVHDGNTLPPAHGTGIAYEPIPLTGEILLKCGFEKGDYNEFRHTNLIGTLTLYDGICEIHLGDLYSVWIESLHRLQNLYFSLTGQELKIKL